MAYNKYLFIINPIAGGLDKKEYIAGLKKKFDQHQVHFDILETTGDGDNDRQRIEQKVEEKKPEVVVAVGGDGTCNMVADLLKHTEIVMGIIPLGSANGLATELSIPQNIEQATDLLLSGKELAIDAILINQKYLCLHLSDIGLNARVVRRFERGEKSRGMLGYFKQYLSEITHLEPKKFKFELNGNQFSRKAHMVVIANASKYGTGAIVNPTGKINDGKFEVCIIKPFPIWSIFSISIALFRGTLKSSRYVKILSCKQIKVFNKPRDVVQIDGEDIGEPKVVNAEILDKALKVIVPQEFKPGELPSP